MTGFGHELVRLGNYSLNIEVNAINRKHLDIQTSLPDSFAAIDADLRATVTRFIARGRVQLSVSVEHSREIGRKLIIDHDFARTCHQELARLQQSLNHPGEVSLDSLLNIPGVLSTDTQPLEVAEYSKEILESLEHALQQCNSMRSREGASLQSDLRQRLIELRQIIAEIRHLAPAVIQHYHKALHNRLAELGALLPLDDERLGREVAVYADRCDITEELVRLDSHFDQFENLLEADGPIGRRLDFLLQEMIREVNTVGSKANDAGISMQVVAAKTELDKMREQIQNVE